MYIVDTEGKTAISSEIIKYVRQSGYTVQFYDSNDTWIDEVEFDNIDTTFYVFDRVVEELSKNENKPLYLAKIAEEAANV